jgi:hypothetical protein
VCSTPWADPTRPWRNSIKFLQKERRLRRRSFCSVCDSTGIFYAASAATGEILWVFDAMTVPNAGGADASPAIYEINGVEYVVYGFGGNAQNSPGIQGDAVIAFALPTATAAAAAKAKAK